MKSPVPIQGPPSFVPVLVAGAMPSGRGSADDLHAFLAPDKLEAKDDGQPEPRKTSARGSARYVHLVQITLQPASEVCRYLLFVLVGLAPFLLVRAPVGMAPVCYAVA